MLKFHRFNYCSKIFSFSTPSTRNLDRRPNPSPEVGHLQLMLIRANERGWSHWKMHHCELLLMSDIHGALHQHTSNKLCSTPAKYRAPLPNLLWEERNGKRNRWVHDLARNKTCIYQRSIPTPPLQCHARDDIPACINLLASAQQATQQKINLTCYCWEWLRAEWLKRAEDLNKHVATVYTHLPLLKKTATYRWLQLYLYFAPITKRTKKNMKKIWVNKGKIVWTVLEADYIKKKGLTSHS